NSGLACDIGRIGNCRVWLRHSWTVRCDVGRIVAPRCDIGIRNSRAQVRHWDGREVVTAESAELTLSPLELEPSQVVQPKQSASGCRVVDAEAERDRQPLADCFGCTTWDGSR